MRQLFLITPLFFAASARSGGKRGAVLVFVLVVVLGLVTVAIYFANAISLEYKAGDNSIAMMEASQACDGARRYIVQLLNNQEEEGRMPDTESYSAEAVALGESRFWIIGRSNSPAGAANQPNYGLVDEASKLNLNIATRGMLEALPNMTSEIAAAILDWRDSDEDPMEDGAEAQAYALLNPAYAPKNGPFESVEELRWVRDITPDILYGEDTNRNGILDANENDGDASAPSDNQDGVLNPGLLEYLTVWSREPNTLRDGTSRVNVAGVQAQQQIREIISEKLGDSRAQQVSQAIGTQPLRSILELYLRSGLDKEEFAQIEDNLCQGEDAFTTGLVNVNTAPEAVLACLPGIGTERAPELVAFRQDKSAEELKSIAWVADAIERNAAIQAGPHITTRSYQFSADVVALGHRAKGMQRRICIIDLAEGSARVVYQRDLSREGWPLGNASLDVDSNTPIRSKAAP